MSQRNTTAVERLQEVETAQATESQQPFPDKPLRIRNETVDADWQAKKLPKLWSRDAVDKPPAAVATKSFAVSIQRPNGDTAEVVVDNCLDEADAKRAALHKLNTHPRDVRVTVKAAA